LSKTKALFDAGMVSQQDYAAQLSAKDAVANRLSQQAITVENAKNSYSDYGRNVTLTATDKRSAVRANAVEQERLLTKINESIIKASINGTLAELSLKEGRNPEPGALVRIYDLSRFTFRAVVPQEDAVKLSVTQPAKVVLKGLEKSYSATVTEVKRFATIDKASGSRTPKVEITLNISDIDGQLIAGYDADATIEVGKAEGVLIVKRESIRKADDGSAYVMKIEGGKILMTSVAIGVMDEFYAEVKSGLKDGDLVVSNPTDDLKSGMSVKAEIE